MGREKHLKNVLALFKKSPVVNYRSIEMIAGKQYAKQLIRNLVLKGEIKKLAKGHYTIHDENSLSVFCFKPGYLGLQDALSFHNLWEQETIPIIITSRRVRQGIRKVMGSNVLIRRIDKKYLFGFDYYEQSGLYLPYSDVEKTLIDMVYFNENISGETLHNIIRKIDRKRLDSYLKTYPSRIRMKVLKYLSRNF